MKNIVLVVLLILSLSAAAQPHFADVLRLVEKNNPTLRAARLRTDAQQQAARQGALLDDPEVHAAYYWGDPAEIGHRWDLSVTQTFQMPSVLARRARLRTISQQAAAIDYEVLRNAILYEAQQACADMVYYSALSVLHDRRTGIAARLAQLYQKRYESGDCSVLEYNRAYMNSLACQSEAAEVTLHAHHLLTDIAFLMDTDYYPFDQTIYDEIPRIMSFDAWYDSLEMNNPQLRKMVNAVEASDQQCQLSTASWLPEVSVGYASENVVGQTFRGATVGLRMPIWSQLRAHSTARLQLAAAQQELHSQRTVLAGELRCVYHQQEDLRTALRNMSSSMAMYDSLELLFKALEAGELTLEQYLQQSEFYMQMEIRLLDLSHQLELAHLQLYSFTL